ncbi:MAG: HAMP domain-containing sensor histidine kinase [Magnetospirillum sp.]|nr:HAMP domain-containing sensor histidine kinase [Magnetospirillum sp.]
MSAKDVKAELAAARNAKFIAAASHHLRQPTQSLMLFLAVLKQRARDVEIEKIAGRIEEAAEAIGRLLDGMLEVAKLDLGIPVPRPEVVFLGDLLKRLADEYAPRANRKGIRCRMVPTSAMAYTDPLLLESALRNLIENALLYTSSGRVLIGCRRRRDAVRIDVIDTGSGIDCDQLGAIFEDFHQGQRARPLQR